MSTILEAPVMEVELREEEIPSLLPGAEAAGTFPALDDRLHSFLPTFPGGASTVTGQRGRFGAVRQDAGNNESFPHSGGPAAPWPGGQPGAPVPPGVEMRREFDQLYHKYVRRVYRQCFRMLHNQEDAEDLTQEVFLQLYRKIHTFRGDSNFSTWLHRLTVNTVLMRMRRNRSWRETVTSLDAAAGPDEGASEVLSLAGLLAAPPLNRVDKISLDVAIAQLSSGYREVFLLHDAEGYRHHEIAGMLGISEGTSKSQLHKARLKLRELMGFSGSRAEGVQGGPRPRDKRKRHNTSIRPVEFAFA